MSVPKKKIVITNSVFGGVFRSLAIGATLPSPAPFSLKPVSVVTGVLGVPLQVLCDPSNALGGETAQTEGFAVFFSAKVFSVGVKVASSFQKGGSVVRVSVQSPSRSYFSAKNCSALISVQINS